MGIIRSTRKTIAATTVSSVNTSANSESEIFMPPKLFGLHGVKPAGIT